MISVVDAIKNRDTQDFKSDLLMAQNSERALAQWMDKQNAYTKIQIVNQKGYDILCAKKNGDNLKIEVKRDFWIDKYQDGQNNRRATNNICIELWSNFPYGNPGWITYSDSNYIFYIGNEQIYILDTIKTKYITDLIVNYGEANRIEPTLKDKKFEKVSKIQYTAHYNGNYKVRSVLVNKDWLIKHNCIVKVINRETSNFNDIAKFYQI